MLSRLNGQGESARQCDWNRANGKTQVLQTRASVRASSRTFCDQLIRIETSAFVWLSGCLAGSILGFQIDVTARLRYSNA